MKQVAQRTNSGYGGLLGQHCPLLGLLRVPDVGVLEENTSYQMKAERVREQGKGGWLAVTSGGLQKQSWEVCREGSVTVVGVFFLFLVFLFFWFFCCCFVFLFFGGEDHLFSLESKNKSEG